MNDETVAQQHLEKAIKYENQGKLNEALVESNLAIQLNPELAEAYNNKGIILELLGDLDGAIVAYEKAVQLQPSSEVAENNLYEAQHEALFLKQKRVLKIVLFGALGYGLSLMLVSVLDASFNGYTSVVGPEGYEVFQPRLGFFPSIFVNTILLSIGIGVGTGILANIIGANNKALLVVSTSVGFGFLYLLLSIAIEGVNFLGFYIFLNEGLLIFTSIMKFALPGAVAGLLFAKVYGNSKNVLVTTLAGSTLGIIGIPDYILLDDFSRFLLILGYYQGNPTMNFLSVGLLFQGIYGFIGGCIFGIALGLALSDFNATTPSQSPVHLVGSQSPPPTAYP